MQIALVTDYYLPTLGGVQTAVHAQREALVATGHEVTVYCPLATPSDDPSIVALPVARRFRPDGYPFTWPPRRAIAALTDHLRRRGTDIVHTHSEMFAALAGIRAAHDLDIPLVHTMHGRIDVYTRHVLPVPAVTTPILARLHHRLVPHGGIELSDAAYTRTRSSRAMWRLMVAQASAVDHVVVPSDHFRRKLAAQGVTTPMTVLSNGVADDVRQKIAARPAPERSSPGTRSEPLRLLWVGRLSPEKRPEVFAAAVRTLGTDVVGDMYGDGLARRSVEREATPVRLHGAVPQEQVLEAMANSDVLVSTSYDFDNQPMVMLEAIATGLPVLYCDPDLAEVVPPGGGFLTPTPDAAGVVTAVRSLLADPEALRSARTAMREASATTALRVDGVEAVYRDAIDRHRATLTDGSPD